MRLKNIKLQIIFRILLLAVSLFFVAYLIFEQKSTVRSIYASIIPIALIIELILLIDRNNRQIRNYLEALEWDDLSIKMPENISNKSFLDLNKSLNVFNTKLERLRRDNFAQYYFIEALVKEALVGLIVVDQENKVFFVNKSFGQIIGKAKIHLYKPVEQELKDIWDKISNLKINEKRSVELSTQKQSKIILFQVSEFKIENEKYRLYSAQNIKPEMESTEIEAWKKLIRILSHEILNSTSPILSLSNTLSDLIHDDNPDLELLIQKLTQGLDVIIQRSSGLIKFTNAFSSISKLPEPDKKTVNLKNLLERLQVLFQKQLDEYHIEFQFKIFPKAEEINADQDQIEQVLINLTKNAIESFEGVSDAKKINVKALNQSNFIRIEVTDNGIGISPDKMDKIFLPFYTTKESGNGIGLALSKQILNQHQGNITIESDKNTGTKIVLDIPVL